MVEINKSLDGTLEKAISASVQLKKMPGVLQDFMLLGDFKVGKAQKVKAKDLGINNRASKFDSTNDSAIQNLAAQLAGLDKSQQSAVFKMSDLSDAAQNATRSILEQTAAQESLSGSLVESALKANGFSDAQAKEVIQNAQLVDSAGNYLVVSKDIAQQNLETALSQDGVSAALQATNQTEKQLAATIVSTVLGQQVQTATTWTQKLALDALTITLSLAKQAAISFGIGLITWAASKAVEYLMNLKTRSEELIDTMNSSHDTAEQAKQDVDDIQSKIDELNDSLEAAGVKKIEDIVDPAERERLQAINDMLQAQLELKKQLEKDTADKANADTSAVVNDKTEKSIYDFEERHDWTGDYTTGKDITKTESLQEYTAALEDTTQKRRDLQVELDQIEVSSGKDSKEYANKKKELDALNETFESQKSKVEELSTAVSEQMGNYKTDADSFAQYKDEYVAGTNAMTAATKALVNAQGDTTVDTTNLDIFSEKVRQIKNDMDNGDSQQSDWKMFNGLGAFSGMTGESIINIDKDTTNQTDAEKTALEKLHQVADDNKISFENLIGVFEAFGIIQTSNASEADSYAEQLEKTMGVIDDIQSAYKTCSSAVEEYNKYGYMSVDSLQSLLQMDDEYLNTLELVNGKLQINQSAYADLLATQYAQAQMEAISQAISELNAIAKGDAAEKAETFTEATEDEKNKLEALAPALKNATIGTGELAGALAAARSAENGDNTEEIEAKISSVMNALNTRLSLISTNMQNAMNGASGLKNQLNGFSDSANKSSGAAQTFLDAWSTLTSAMKEFNEQNYLSMQTVQDLTGLEDKYTSLLKKNDVTGKLEIQTSKFQDLMEAELKEAKIKGDNATASQYNKILGWTDRNIQKQTMSYWDLVAAIEGYSAALEEAKGITDTFKDAWDNGKTVKEKTEKSRAGALDYEGTEAQSSALQDLLKYSEYDPELIGKVFNKETGKVDLSGDMLKNAVVKSLEAQATAARTEGGAAAEAIAQSYEKSAENIKNDVISVQDYFDGLGSTIDEVNTKIDDIQSAFTDLDDVANEYNAYGGLSVDAMQKLLTMQPEYLECLEMNGDQLVFNRDKMVELLIAQLESRKELLLSKDETKDQAQIIQQMIDALKKDGVNAIAGMTYQADKLQTIFSNLKDLFSSMLDVFNKFNDNNSNDLKIYGDAMTDEIDKRIEALQNANDEQEKAIELAKLQAELEKAETQKTVRVYTSNGYEWQADESAIKEARDNLNSKQRENALNDEIDKLNKLKDKYAELINLIGSSYEDYQKKQEYAAKIQGMTFDQMTAGLDGFESTVIANMKAIQGATNVNNVVTNLTNLVNTLVKLNDVLNGLSTGTTQSGGITGLFNRVKNAFSSFSDKSSGKGFFGRLLDAGKSALGIGGSNKYTAAKDFLGESTSEIPKLGQTIAKSLGSVKTTVTSTAQGIFSGSGGLASIFQQGFSGVASIAQKAIGGLGSVFGNISTTLGGTKLFSGIAGIFEGIGTTVKAAIGTAGGTGVAGTIAAAVSHIPVIGTILLGGTLAVSAIGGGSLTTGLSRIGKGIASAVSALGKTLSKAVKGVGSMLSSVFHSIFGGTSSNGKKHKGIGSWKIWPWNWGRAKGDKHIDQAAPYNVDEEGEEIIVRNPAKGRMTYLEKGDGVIPANTTENLMEIGKNPREWLANALKKIQGTQKLTDFVSDSLSLDKLKNAKTKGDILSITKDIANGQMKKLQSKFEAAWKELGGDVGLTEEQIDSISGTIFDRMGSMITNTMDSALNNKELTDDQIKELCASMFQRMGYIYENGWDNLYSLSPDMPKDMSEKLHTLFDTISSDFNNHTATINQILADKIGSISNTMATTVSTGSGGYHGNSMDANIGPSASFNFSKVKKTVQDLFEKFSSSKLGTWLNKHSLGNVVDKLTRYNSTSDPNLIQRALHLLTHPTELIASAVEGAVKTGKKVTWAVTHPKEAAQEIASAAKNAYSKGKDVVSKAKDAVTHPKETAEKVVDKVRETYNNVKDTVSKAANSAKDWIKEKADKITGKKATGSRSIGKSGTYNVDEKGQELIVRQPETGRYTYLETGDGVVPADITSKLFDLGGNPDAWFQKQLAKNGGLTANIQTREQTPSISVGDIYIQKPIGDVDSLARAINNELPNALLQQKNKR
mgnify:CR=1 FL=1